MKTSFYLLTDDQINDVYKQLNCFEDWQLQKHHFDFLMSLLTWKPTIDATCDVKGSNKMCPKFLSVE